MVLTFCLPRAFFKPSWLQVAIFIDLELVLAALGCLPGLSWEGLWAVLASSRAYLGLSCGSLLLSSGCLGSPALPVQDLSKICARSVQDLSKMPAGIAATNCTAQNRWAAVAPPTGLPIKSAARSSRTAC